MMEASGIYLARDAASVGTLAESLPSHTDRIGGVVASGRSGCARTMPRIHGILRPLREATTATRESAGTVESVAGDLGEVAARLRGQVDQFFAKLNTA